tara:strand:+ start:869 stop:1396 length:528 start_codon:yes stop_codon:yes gene_type:complete
MADNKIIQEALVRENKVIIDALKKELNFQKHIGKGTLYNGFYYKIVNRTDSISLQILNDTPYMWLVNDGKSTGVNASYNDIDNWTYDKEKNGELTFGSEHERANFVSSVKEKLEDGYYTAGGKVVAPRRYFFIDFARESWKKSGAVKRIEDAIVKDVQGVVDKELVKKEIKLTIG